MSKLLNVLVVLALGLHVTVPEAKDVAAWSFEFNGPALAVMLYGILVTVTLFKTLNHLPGVLALRRPLGVVKSGYEYLWGPAILAVLAGISYSGVIEGRSDSEYRHWTAIYGAASQSILPAVALAVFALLMWSLKLRAAMIAANQSE